MMTVLTASRFLAPLAALLLVVVVALLGPVETRAEAPVQIVISPTTVCALTESGEIDCWGFDTPLIHDVPEGVFTSLSLGPGDACAIGADGAAVCWGTGYGYVRELIDGILERNPGTDPDSIDLSQLLPPSRTDLVEVVVHPWRHYACARTSGGEIVCWGRPVASQSAPSANNFIQLISTGREFCALDSEGQTTCWGHLNIEQFVSDAGPFVRIAASGNGLCGFTAEGDIRCLTARSRTAPGPPQPYIQLFRNVHLLGSQGCAILDDGTLQCRQTHHWCHELIPADIDHCPPDLIRFQYWAIPFTILFEGGPDREATTARTYTQLFGDQAACAITTDGQIDCWSDFRQGDPRLDVPERFRPQLMPEEPEPEAEEDEPEP
ncbi:MAG: hypothetical protein OXI41_10350 [Chloroflexota bacterium]|nr:hypothetical protein [Chloroflexota bacterium]MDE2894110.1 hypothetical protein [Chloroflexota bacterium]